MRSLPKDFWLLCLSTLLFTLSFNLILPEMNNYLESINEGKNKWAVFVPWTITAMLLRPLSGKMADILGRKFVINLGIFFSIIASFFYPFALVLSTFFMVRFIHGFSVGFQPTGASALAADLIPEKIRGEAMGFFSISISLGFGIGQILSTPLKSVLGYEGLFHAVAIVGFLSLIILLPVKETQKRLPNLKVYSVLPKINEVIAPEVFVSALIMLLITLCTGFYMLVIPDYSVHLGIENKGAFFFTHMLSSLVVRYVAGKLSDRIGRINTLIIGVGIFMSATVFMIFVNDMYLFFFCGFLYGVGTGIISPTIMAWTTDLSNPQKKGRGLATMWMGLEFGFMLGAFFGALIYQNNSANFYLLFSLVSIILLIIFLMLIVYKKKVPIKFEA